MALKSYTRLMIAYGNEVNPSAVTSVVTSGISAFETGFPASNLEYEDPWTRMKTASISAEPIVEHQFSSSISPRVLGIVNHNFYSAGYSSVEVEYHTGSVWSSIGTVTLPSTNQDILIPWDNVVSATRFRWRLGSAQGNFVVGSVFYGIEKVFERNPRARGISQERQTPLVVEQSAGGARHASFGASRRTSDMSLTWSRGTMVDRGFFEQLDQENLVGVYSPEHGDAVQTVAVGSPIFWGYVERVRDEPRGPGAHLTSQAATYDWTVFLRGAA